MSETFSDGRVWCCPLPWCHSHLAGPEIQARFFTLEHNDVDDSANSRRRSWAAAWKMAKDNPIFGVGIRNANLFSYQYGADMEGRTIHSQYLQIAADNGFVGMGLYLAMIASVWADTRFCRRAVKGRDDLQSRRIYLVATGVETSMAVFCFGGAFLSLENFELPFLLLLLGSQLAALVKGQLAGERVGLETRQVNHMLYTDTSHPPEGLLMPGASFPVRDLDVSHLQPSAPRDRESDPSAEREESAGGGDLKRRVRIGFVLHVMQVAGAEMLVTEIVRRTRGMLEPTIFCLDGIGPLGEQLRDEGVEVIDLKRRPGQRLSSGLAHEPADPAAWNRADSRAPVHTVFLCGAGEADSGWSIPAHSDRARPAFSRHRFPQTSAHEPMAAGALGRRDHRGLPVQCGRPRTAGRVFAAEDHRHR